MVGRCWRLFRKPFRKQFGKYRVVMPHINGEALSLDAINRNLIGSLERNVERTLLDSNRE